MLGKTPNPGMAWVVPLTSEDVSVCGIIKKFGLSDVPLPAALYVAAVASNLTHCPHRNDVPLAPALCDMMNAPSAVTAPVLSTVRPMTNPAVASPAL
jgi:hypothetical protein